MTALFVLPFPVPFSEWVSSDEFYWSTFAKRQRIESRRQNVVPEVVPVGYGWMGLQKPLNEVASLPDARTASLPWRAKNR